MKCFPENSRTAYLINNYPWSKSSLGPIESWPASLRVSIAIMLEARIPMYVAWGPEFIQFYNDAYLPILGQKGENAIGKSTWETWDEIWPVIGPMFKSVMFEGESHGFPNFVLFLQRFNSSFTEETFFDFSYSPIRNDDGTIGGLFLSCLETTERALHERRMEMLATAMPINYEKEFSDRFLADSHKQLSLSPRDLPYSLFVEHDLEKDSFRCLSSFGVQNAERTKSFLSPEGVSIMRKLETEGLYINKQIFKEGLDFYLKPWEEHSTHTYIITYQYKHYKKRNIVMLGVGSRAVFTDAYKQFFRLCGKYLQNQYEHFQLRKQEEEQLEAIKELSVKKDEFISVASHELKTPLTSAKAFLQVAARSAGDNGNSKFITGALKQLDRLQGLTSDLLDVSKINAGRLDYKMAEVEFGEVLREAVANFQSTVSTHSIEIAEQADTLVEGDYQRLEQVINNLLSNAVKYSPRANRIVVRSAMMNGHLVVSVRDFGVGIPSDRIHRLFERFYRIEETAMHFQGMGLGLFIVAEILSRHKGRFWLESVPGEGSTFYFMLPVKNAEIKITEIRDEPGLYIDEHISITADYENQWLYVDWTGFQDNQTVRSGGYKMLSMLKETGFTKVLNDNRNVLGTWSDAAEWAGREWFPMMEAAGMKCFAWIYSRSTFSQLSADKAIDVLRAGIVTRFFNDKEEAMEWLKQC